MNQAQTVVGDKITRDEHLAFRWAKDGAEADGLEWYVIRRPGHFKQWEGHPHSIQCDGFEALSQDGYMNHPEYLEPLFVAMVDPDGTIHRDGRSNTWTVLQALEEAERAAGDWHIPESSGQIERTEKHEIIVAIHNLKAQVAHISAEEERDWKEATATD